MSLDKQQQQRQGPTFIAVSRDGSVYTGTGMDFFWGDNMGDTLDGVDKKRLAEFIFNSGRADDTDFNAQ